MILVGERPENEIICNKYNRVVNYRVDSTYTIDNISLKYEMVAQPDFTRQKEINVLFDLEYCMNVFFIIGVLQCMKVIICRMLI